MASGWFKEGRRLGEPGTRPVRASGLDLDGLDDRVHLGEVFRQRPGEVPALDHHADAVDIEAPDVPSVVRPLGVEGGRPGEVAEGDTWRCPTGTEGRGTSRRYPPSVTSTGVVASRSGMGGERVGEIVGGRPDLDVRWSVIDRETRARCTAIRLGGSAGSSHSARGARGRLRDRHVLGQRPAVRHRERDANGVVVARFGASRLAGAQAVARSTPGPSDPERFDHVGTRRYPLSDHDRTRGSATGSALATGSSLALAPTSGRPDSPRQASRSRRLARSHNR